MTIRELKRWLEKMEREGAEELTVEVVNQEEAFDQVRLTAVEPSGVIAESIILIS